MALAPSMSCPRPKESESLPQYVRPQKLSREPLFLSGFPHATEVVRRWPISRKAVAVLCIVVIGKAAGQSRCVAKRSSDAGSDDRALAPGGLSAKPAGVYLVALFFTAVWLFSV